MLKPTRDACDFCARKAYTRTFAGDNLCYPHSQGWTRAMNGPRKTGQLLGDLWEEWAAVQRKENDAETTDRR
jgi:hypothetical protein